MGRGSIDRWINDRYINIHLYIRISVYTPKCWPICLYMHLSIYHNAHTCTDAWMDGWMDWWMDVRTHACMHECVYGCMDGCTGCTGCAGCAVCTVCICCVFLIVQISLCLICLCIHYSIYSCVCFFACSSSQCMCLRTCMCYVYTRASSKYS